MRPTAEPPAALPYDLAMDIREFLWSSTRFYARLLSTETDRRSMGHVISEWTRPNAVDAAQRIVEFIRAHLGPPKARTITPE